MLDLHEAQTALTFDKLHDALRRKGLPCSRRWLRAELRAGRLPHVRAGRHNLFNLTSVQRAIAERAGAVDGQ